MPVTLTYQVQDSNGNPLPAGTTIQTKPNTLPVFISNIERVAPWPSGALDNTGTATIAFPDQNVVTPSSLLWLLQIPDNSGNWWALNLTPYAGTTVTKTLQQIYADGNAGLVNPATVVNAIQGPGVAPQSKTVTANYSVLTTDDKVLVNASGRTITLPNAVAVTPGRAYSIKNSNLAAGTTVVTTAGGNVDNASSVNLVGALTWGRYFSDGTNWWSV